MRKGPKRDQKRLEWRAEQLRREAEGVAEFDPKANPYGPNRGH